MTPSLATLRSYVGALPGGAEYRRVSGRFVLHALQGPMCDIAGWWCFVSYRDLVIAVAWVAGDHRDRDRELARRLAIAASTVSPASDTSHGTVH